MTPFGQLLIEGVEKQPLWNEGYKYEQVMAALVWLVTKIESTNRAPVKVVRQHGYVTTHPSSKVLAKEIDALLDLVLKKDAVRWGAKLCFHLRFDHAEEAELVAGVLGKPSLRVYNLDEKLFAHSLGSMEWIEDHYRYKDLLPLSGKQMDDYRHLDCQEGKVRLWHKHITGDVLILEVEEGDLYRLWDVNSVASRAQHRRLWAFNNSNLAHYISDGMVSYGRFKYFSLYGPVYDGIRVNRRGIAVVNVEPLRSSFPKLLARELLTRETERLELRFVGFYLKRGAWIDWLSFRVNGQSMIDKAIDTESPFCLKLEEWFGSASSYFPPPISNVRFIVKVDLLLENKHDFLELLDDDL